MNRRWYWLSCLSLITAICSNGICIADESAKARSIPLVGMISLIVKESVQKELGIDPGSEELANIKAILKPFSTVLQDRLNRPSKEDLANQLSAQELYAKIESDFVEQLRLILKPEQFGRLQQIHWQRWGVRSIEDPEMADALELNQVQIQQIKSIRDQFQVQRKELERLRRTNPGHNSDEFKEKLSTLDADQLRAYSELLSPEQLSRLDELKGKPFESADPPSAPGKREPNATIRSRSDNLLQLVLMEPVLEELAIGPTTPLMIDLHKLYRAFTRDRRELSSSRSPGNGERSVGTESASSLQLKYEEELKRLLTPQQFRRLREIYIQRMGTDALYDVEVASHLNLTSDQRAQLAELNLEKVRKARDLVNLANGKQANGIISDEIKKKIQDSISERENRAFEILSPTQRDKWQEMTGKPFDQSKLRRSATAP